MTERASVVEARTGILSVMRKLVCLFLTALLVPACGSQAMRGKAQLVVAPPRSTPKAPAPHLIYATKAGSRVTVYSVSLRTHRRSVVLRYRERTAAEHSGNKWDELIPSVSLSSKGVLAYGAIDGVHLFDLKTRRRTTIIARTVPEVGERAPRWTPDQGDDTYGFYTTAWSPDGRYVSFSRAHYEGNTYRIYDVTERRMFEQRALPYSYAEPSLGDMGWAKGSATTIVTANGESNGFYASDIDDPSRASYTQIDREGIIASATLSPDGTWVAFTSTDGPDWGEATRLATVARDGTGLVPIDDAGTKSAPFVQADGDVWWFESGSLLRWNDRTDIVASLDPAYRWSLIGIDKRGIMCAGIAEDDRRARFALVDPADGSTTFEHATATDFTTFLGLV